MAREIKIGNRLVGDGQPAYIIAEIGINHNGNLETAKEMIFAAQETGADAVKFQKRTPELCVPKDQWDIMRETPWGYISYIDYREKVEFGLEEYKTIDAFCRELGLTGLHLFGMRVPLISWKTLIRFATKWALQV